MPTRFVIIAIISIASLLGACIFSGSGPANNDDSNNVNNDPDPLCGNGRIDPGETCDPCDKFSCPTGGCGIWAETGDAADCNLACTKSGEQTACGDGDNCCPEGCSETDDSDCSEACGDGVIDEDETCDPCPDTCPDEPCAPVEQSGDPTTCNLVCSPLPEPMGCCGGALCPDGMVCTPADQCVEPGCIEDEDCNDPNAICDDGVCEVPPGCLDDTSCALWERCTDDGRCVEAENCDRARDPEAWCAYHEFIPGGQRMECIREMPPTCLPGSVECDDNTECQPWEICADFSDPTQASPCNDNSTECLCATPNSCAAAQDGGLYCQLMWNDPEKVCNGEQCI